MPSSLVILRKSGDSPHNPETWYAWFTLMELCCQADWNSDGVVVKFLLAEQEARDSIPNLTTTISEIGYLLLPSLNLA